VFNTYEYFDELNKRNVKIRFDAGQPDLSPNKEILEALIGSLDKMGYGSARGLDELCEEIAQLHGVKREQVVITPGSKFAVAALIHNTKCVSLIAPYWPGYKGTADLLGVGIDVSKSYMEDGWLPRVWTPKGDSIILNYPNNPTGTIPSREFTDKVIEEAEVNGRLIISDEVYRDIAFGERRFSILDYMPKRFALIHSCSKTFSMPGLRLGYVVGDVETVKKVVKFIRATITTLPIFSQRAAVKAIRILEKEKDRITKVYKQRVQYACENLDSSLFKFKRPDGGFYMWLKLPNINGTEFAYKLMEKDVGIFPGEAFGEEYVDYLRMSLVCDGELLERGIRTVNETARNWGSN